MIVIKTFSRVKFRRRWEEIRFTKLINRKSRVCQCRVQVFIKFAIWKWGSDKKDFIYWVLWGDFWKIEGLQGRNSGKRVACLIYWLFDWFLFCFFSGRWFLCLKIVILHFWAFLSYCFKSSNFQHISNVLKFTIVYYWSIRSIRHYLFTKKNRFYRPKFIIIIFIQLNTKIVIVSMQLKRFGEIYRKKARKSWILVLYKNGLHFLHLELSI